MKSYSKILCVFGLQLFSLACYAEQVSVKSLHYSTKSNQARMLFDVSASPKHRVFVMDNPSRLVIDIKNASLAGKLSQPSASHPLFSRVRAGLKNDADLRIVVDLKKPITSKAFSLSSDNKDEHSLVVDLLNKGLAFSATKSEDKEKKTKSDDLNLVLRKLTENTKAVEAKKVNRKPGQLTADAVDN
ncbi:MAG: AMIN domain-containing protein, partial [Methylobacter sp.]